jgi:16S rRNA (guanine966-N2)-methyltransferase
MRISGGVHRSRVLASPRGKSTRPTSDRVREALFSMLDARGAIAAARVIDFFAGTGALGLEALSRGASFATFVESDRRALEALARNIGALGERARTRVVPMNATRAVTTLTGDRATLAFLDPPYAEVAHGLGKLFNGLATRDVLAPGATIVLEHATRDTTAAHALASPDLRVIDTRPYGDTTLSLFAYGVVYTRPTS